MYKKQKEKQKKLAAVQKRKNQQICVGIKFQSWLKKQRVKLLGIANERFPEVGQIMFAYADIHGNTKIMLRSPFKYLLGIQTENDIANILSKLDCKYRRFGKIYPSDGT